MGSIILLDDGLIELVVTKIDVNEGIITTFVQNAGTLKNNKGVNVPGVSVQLPGINSVISYQMAYLKTHFPVPFYCALLSTAVGNQEKINQLLMEMKQKNISVLPPSIYKNSPVRRYATNWAEK